VIRLARWLAARLPMESIQAFARAQAAKPLPPNVSWFHTFGSLLLFLLANQIVTGVLLMVYYRPTTDQAFDSVRYISAKAAFGWLIRGLHSWGSTLMVLFLLLHMARTFFMGAFKHPRELTWMVGVLIFGAALTFCFTGYLLPWSQLSYWATTVGTEISGSIPVAGPFLKRLLLGGEAVSQETLLRFYVVHVVVLPWVTVGLVALHLALVRTQGLATMDRVGAEAHSGPGWRPFFPNHVLKELTVFSVFLAAVITLVVLWPPEIGDKADPLNTPAGIKPEWYFLPTYQMLKYFPALLGILVSLLPPVLLLIWPLLDRTPERRCGKRPVSATFGIAAILIAVLMGLLGYLSEREVRVFGRRVHFDHYGIPTRAHDPAPK
jgi:quinol-cytochrome oxidoreductase complex cytochrome b subunit